jgi:hypothetical protein
MKLFSVNIGPDNPVFNQAFPGFTQVMVCLDYEIAGRPPIAIAQFFGLFAKLTANAFIEAQRTSIDSLEYTHDD